LWREAWSNSALLFFFGGGVTSGEKMELPIPQDLLLECKW
jgi:hypothetical protein